MTPRELVNYIISSTPCSYCGAEKYSSCIIINSYTRATNRNDIYPEIHLKRLRTYEKRKINEYIKKNKDKLLFLGEENSAPKHKRHIRFED
jgi:hypothetical protein